MLFIPNEALDPAYNQAFEECAFDLPTHEDLLLIWRNRPAVVCGRYQNVFQEVHLPAAERQGVQIVRRLTGGGCVYHDPGNVNYTIITDSEDGAGYDAVLERVIQALKRVGVPVERFQTSALAIGGRKISGSAQRASKGRLLHHGTLLFDADLDSLRRLANGHSGCYSSKAIKSEPSPVTNIREHLRNGPMDVDGFRKRLTEAFEPEGVMPVDLSRQAQRLAEEKYSTWEWTYANSPRYEFARAFDFCGAEMRVAYTAQKGVIGDISIECAGTDCAALTDALRGQRLELSAVREKLGAILGNPGTAEQMLAGLF